MDNIFGRPFGACLIVVGTGLGAGMLALPIFAMQIGYLYSMITLLVMWLLMYFTACITVDIMAGNQEIYSIAKLAQINLGKATGYVTSFSMLCLFYALLSAYISGGGSILYNALLHLPLGENLNEQECYALFVLTVAAIVFVCTEAVDYINRVCIVLKFSALATLLILLWPQANLSVLSRTVEYNGVINALPLVVPAFMTSFGFHGSIPAVIKYTEGSKATLKKVMLIGTLIPLVIYALWITMSVAVIQNPITAQHIVAKQNDIGYFIMELGRSSSDSSLFTVAVDAFSWFAITTSFLGVAIGLYDYLFEILRYKERGLFERLKALTLTFGGPALIVYFKPKIFVIALNYAAAFLSILAVVIPTFIVMKQMRLRPTNEGQASLRFMRLTWLALANVAGVIIILCVFANLFS